MMWDLRASDLIFLFLDHVQKKQKAQRPQARFGRWPSTAETLPCSSDRTWRLEKPLPPPRQSGGQRLIFFLKPARERESLLILLKD